MDNLDDQLDQWIAEAPPLPAHLQAASDRINAKLIVHIWDGSNGVDGIQLNWDGDGDTCGITKALLEDIDDTLMPFDWGEQYLQLGEWWFELTYIPEWDAYVARRLDNPPTEE